ncbi:MAG: alpha/beta fold hydrolase [Dermatophilaceae bacterium]|nr:alpha/beta fold hydrolase [Intrasporangiaceae bacterium]
MPITSAGIAYDRRPGASQGPALLFLHTGVAERRMWDRQWADLPAELDLTRLDLRGFGESTTAPPGGSFSHTVDALVLMDELGLGRVHLVGSSLGAGVAVELALTDPERVDSLLLAPPGGCLIATASDALRAFFIREGDALDRGDLDAAV